MNNKRTLFWIIASIFFLLTARFLLTQINSGANTSENEPKKSSPQEKSNNNNNGNKHDDNNQNSRQQGEFVFCGWNVKNYLLDHRKYTMKGNKVFEKNLSNSEFNEENERTHREGKSYTERIYDKIEKLIAESIHAELKRNGKADDKKAEIKDEAKVEEYKDTKDNEYGKEYSYTIGKKKSGSINRIISTLKKINADAVGLVEIGNEADVKDIQKRLREQGVDYPYFSVCQTDSSSRRVALISKHPITSVQHQVKLPYKIGSAALMMRRGIFDAHVKTPSGKTYRLLGVHLKSKRPSFVSEEKMRIKESIILKRHIMKILEENPNENIILFGDFNSYKNELPIQIIGMGRDKKSNLHDVHLYDKNGQAWTHYWRYADNYSRLDYIFVPKKMIDKLNRNNTYIYYDKDFYDASDHRPYIATFRD